MDEKSPQAVQKPTGNAVYMENLSSVEMVSGEPKGLSPILSEISLSLNGGESWGFFGSSSFEVRLLLEILSNIKPYGNGTCKLAGIGMMRRKRIILPHVFYIGNAGMVYNNMNVLEFLMFATAKSPEGTVERQSRIFEYLIRIGLGNISLTPVNTLSREQKAVVVLLVAALSDSRLVVFNFPDYRFDDVLCGAISDMARLIRENNRALAVGTLNGGLIEAACTHIALLQEGRILHQGPVGVFRETRDTLLLTVWDKDLALWADRLKADFPQYGYRMRDGGMAISSGGSGERDAGIVYRKLLGAGFYPQKVVVNPKTVSNACEEVLGSHDIQE
jgi:ABC-2 type transport system ATP-binding protein